MVPSSVAGPRLPLRGTAPGRRWLRRRPARVPSSLATQISKTA